MILPNDSNPLTNPFHSQEDEDWIRAISDRYKWEEQLTNAIQQGRADTAEQIVKDGNFQALSEFSYLPLDTLELGKQCCRVMNVICRVAARAGGLPPLYVHNLSEKFGLIINGVRDIEILSHYLPLRIVKSYAQAVAEFSTSSYSPLVADAVRYVNGHVTSPLEISELASSLYVSPEHLSRKFKQETGKTISKYAHCQRIAIAKVLFAQGNTNLTEVAVRTGYHDSSHFSKTFKKVCGISPKDYIVKMQEHSGHIPLQAPPQAAQAHPDTSAPLSCR